MTAQYTDKNFSSGKGDMSKESFFAYINRVGVNDAVWLAKYLGVSLNTVKIWVSEHIERNWK